MFIVVHLLSLIHHFLFYPSRRVFLLGEQDEQEILGQARLLASNLFTQINRIASLGRVFANHRQSSRAICECFYASRHFSNACWWEEGLLSYRHRRRRDAADSQDQILPLTRGRFGTFPGLSTGLSSHWYPLRKSVTHIRQLNPQP